MRIIADLHLHSRYAQACSKDTTIALLEKWGKIKGITLLGTGDFTHPEWIKELKRELVTEKDGIHYTKTGQPFLLSTEISFIYTQEKGRRVHLVVLAPSFDAVNKITEYLKRHGRVDYDGRPIFKIPCHEFVKQMRNINENIEVIPAHAWTPWFSVFGSKSGFDSLRECFLDQTAHIHAIETGLSSDVEMNDSLSQLDGVRYVSFSDAHSYWPWRLGREATIFELESLTYQGILQGIRTGKGFWGTIEVEPSYGKYHVDGHRACDVVLEPAESNKLGKICPTCKKPLTIGVLNRVEELADRNVKPSQRYLKIIPLHDIISLVLEKGINTKTVWKEYWKIMEAGKDEYDILLNISQEALEAVTSKEIASAIVGIREGNVEFTPGYDGVYGVPKLSAGKKQKGLGDFL